MFDTLLVANRGEIAVRILRTARAMGLRTVAVYSDADRDAPHVAMADEAVRIGPGDAARSYLDAQAVLRAARATGAGAIHPGYGFLSERPELVDGCDAAGIAWVGPPASAIRAMGDKIEAKRAAQAAGVPCLPGAEPADQSPAGIAAAARAIGLPVMVKAAAGGGGKGIRPVHRDEDLDEAVALARAEALRAFGDGRLLVERFIGEARHVEVQLLADAHGTVIALGDRDCSLQRANQKLIEEAPAPGLPDAVRARIRNASVALAQAIGYRSAGTVEFIYDPAREEAAFLEMNTRLQVEHTVTEAIYGIDLVEWQLRIAAGEALDPALGRTAPQGHAIEARLTAEDAAAGFQPGTGRVMLWRAPEGVRIDTGVGAGTEVGALYDSLLAKVVAHGPSREVARRRLDAGLAGLRCMGVPTTRTALRRLIAHSDFASGAMTTSLIARDFPGGIASGPPLPRAMLLALATHLSAPVGSVPFGALAGFRVTEPVGLPARAWWDVGGTEVRIDGAEPDFTLTSAREEVALRATLAASTLSIELPDGRRIVADLSRSDERIDLSADAFDLSGRVRPAVEAAEGSASDAPGDLRTPMVGLIAEVRAAPGDAVEAGAVVAVLESMKMLMELRAPMSGRVAEVRVEAGATVPAGTLVARLEES